MEKERKEDKAMARHDQISMFTDGSDLPLFSGTCQRGQVDCFKPGQEPQQPPLFDLAPTFGESGNWGKITRLAVQESKTDRAKIVTQNPDSSTKSEIA